MRERALLLASVGLNIGLAASLVYWPRPAAPLATPVLPETNSAAVPVVKTRVLVRKQFFSWSDIETNDYAAYISNLRDIECPEPTIRDIIVSEINLLYARRRASEVPSTSRQWWRSVPDPQAVREASDKIKALETERVALLDKLLGKGWESSLPESQIPVVDLSGPVLGDLTPEAKKAVEQIANAAQNREDAYRQDCLDQGVTEDPKELARLQRESRAELAKVLNSAQMEEYLLRYSPTADRLRQELLGFEAKPEEFRQIFRNVDATEQQIQLNYAGDDPAMRKKREELLAQSDAAVQQALGSDRSQLYELTRDPAFGQARQMAEQYGASAEAVLPVYQITQMTQTQVQRIQNDSSLSDEERKAALRQVQEDEEKSIQSILAAKSIRRPTDDASGPPLPPP